MACKYGTEQCRCQFSGVGGSAVDMAIAAISLAATIGALWYLSSRVFGKSRKATID